MGLQQPFKLFETVTQCVSVDHVREPCKNGWNDRDAVWMDDLGGPINHALDGIQITKVQREEAILGVAQPTESIVSHCCDVRSKKSITASTRLLQPTALLRTDRCHINFPHEPDAALQPASKFVDHFYCALYKYTLCCYYCLDSECAVSSPHGNCRQKSGY